MQTETRQQQARGLKVTDILLIFSWVILLVLTRQFMQGADHYLQLTREALGKYFDQRWFLLAHITAGGGSLLLGLPQFSDRLLKSSPKVHRTIGILYLLAVLVSSVCAVVLAYTTAYAVNWAYAFSAQVWSSIRIVSTFIAYRSALIKKFKLHKEWMTRSYIVTVAFLVSGLALKLPVVQQLGSFEDISPSLFWMGWSVPLFIYQVVLAFRAKS